MSRWVLAAMAAAALACGNDNGGDVVDGGPPRADAAPDDGGTDCMQPTFTDIQAKILRNVRCTVCHDTGVGLGGLTLPADQAASYAIVLGNTLGGMPAKRVVANDPDNSSFYLKLLEPPPFGFRMPQGGQLTLCEINAFRQWILNGANND